MEISTPIHDGLARWLLTGVQGPNDWLPPKPLGELAWLSRDKQRVADCWRLHRGELEAAAERMGLTRQSTGYHARRGLEPRFWSEAIGEWYLPAR